MGVITSLGGVAVVISKEVQLDVYWYDTLPVMLTCDIYALKVLFKILENLRGWKF